MYSPCCTAHQSIVSGTLKDSVTLGSGSILGALAGGGTAQGTGTSSLSSGGDGFCPGG